MLGTLGAISTDETPCDLNAEMLQVHVLEEENKERLKAQCLHSVVVEHR